MVPSYQGRAIQVREEAQQMQYIAFDAHKHYTIASVEQQTGGVVREMRLAHERGVIRDFLGQCAPG